MKTTSSFFVVLVTAPDQKTARRIAKSALAARLIACANLITGVESHYWWQSKLEAGEEVLMVMKTSAARLKALQKHILAAHPYDTPEFLALRVDSGSRRYLNWLAASVK
jgi:periplasmic divalent cation tolerance protein